MVTLSSESNVQKIARPVLQLAAEKNIPSESEKIRMFSSAPAVRQNWSLVTPPIRSGSASTGSTASTP